MEVQGHQPHDAATPLLHHWEDLLLCALVQFQTMVCVLLGGFGAVTLVLAKWP